MTSLFDVDYANDIEANTQGRRATAAALARTKQRFGAFLSGGDLPARFDLIESDFKQVVADVVAEYGGDADKIENSVTAILAAGGYCDTCKAWKSGPRAGGCTCSGGTREHEDGPSESADDEANADDSADAGGTTAATKRAAAGACPTCGSLGQMTGKMGNRDMYQCPQCHSKYAEFDTGPAGQLGVMNQHPSVQADPSQSVAPPGLQPAMAHWRLVGEALETEKLPSPPFGSEPWDNGPSPKMDHKEWKPNATNPDGNLKPIDTEGAGSPHPTEHHDIARSTDHTRDPLEQTRGGKGVTETEKLKGHDDPDKAGFDTKKDITQYPTRTFGDKGQQDSGVGDAAYPEKSQGVTSANVNCELCEDKVDKGDTRVVDGLRLCQDCRGAGTDNESTSDEPQTSDLERSSAADPDRNPIRESLRAEHGILPQGELDVAISNFRS